MVFDQRQIETALSELSEKYSDKNCNNNKRVDFPMERGMIEDTIFEHLSMKRSHFYNVNYNQCKFINVAFNGSSFDSVDFTETKMEGNSLACCEFTDVTISGGDKNDGNNCSQTNFINCHIGGTMFSGSAFLQSIFHHTSINDVIFRSCTLEGSRFINCELADVNFGNANIEFTDFLNTCLENVIFPFYQFAYIIGIADYLQNNANIFLRCGETDVSLQEYASQIDNLILYYFDKTDYFPMCNLYIAKHDMSTATDCLLIGINSSLQDLDFRMIRHYCRLAKRHNLLNEVTNRRISDAIDSFLTQDSMSPEKLNDCMIHVGEIRQILNSGSQNAVELNLRIRTNITKDNTEGVNYVNSLSNEISSWLSNNTWGHEGFQVAVSNHSPFELIIDVVCAAGAIATIADFIWKIITTYKSNHKTNPESTDGTYYQVDPAMLAKYVNTRIDLCKEQLRNLNKKNYDKKINAYIEEITQQLKTDLVEFYDSDIIIFKKKNK